MCYGSEMNTLTSGEVLKVLGLFGVVEWARMSVGRDPVDGLAGPPLIVWRYVGDSDEAERRIRRILDSVECAVEWSFGHKGRNLGLLPKILKEQIDAHPEESDSQTMAHFKHSNPTFCERANDDLSALFRTIESIMRSG